jgi:NAD(P)-dependent dehydrogenase (short-subunit alcohol dehydrogenase family)
VECCRCRETPRPSSRSCLTTTRPPRWSRRLTPRQIAERSAGNLLPVPWIEPEDVAQAVLYLASDKARFMTGAGLVLDAGLLTR